MVERKFTPADIIEGQLPVEDPTPIRREANLAERILNSQIIFEARKHLARRAKERGK